MNCAFVTEDRRFITPTFDKILAGTTVRKLLELAKRLVAEGTLASVSQEKVPVAVARECVEMMLMGGDHHFLPVVEWDGRPVGQGKLGEVYRRLLELLHEDSVKGSGDDHYELLY